MPKIRKTPPPPPRLSNPQVEAAGKAATTVRSGGTPTTDAAIRSTFSPGTADIHAFERLSPIGPPVPNRISDVYSANTPANMAALDPRFGFLPVRMPTKEELAGAAKVEFGLTGYPRAGSIKAGQKMVVQYAADRSPVQENLGSVPAWGVTAFIEFQPSGKRIEAPAVAFPSNQGRISPQPYTAPVLVDVPAGTTGVTMWFRQFKGADHPGEGWDSNYGHNYKFPVTP